MVLLSVATAVLVVAAVVHPGQRLGRGAGLDAAALDRRALLRHLPVAFPDHRADNPDGTTVSSRRGPRFRWPRPSASPRCRGGSSRSRSAMARWAPGARIREGTWKPKALAQNVRVAVGVGLATPPARVRGPGRSGASDALRVPARRRTRTRTRRPRSPAAPSSHTEHRCDHAGGHGTQARHLVQLGRAHRRLHLGGPRLHQLPARTRRAHRGPLRRSARQDEHIEISGATLDRRDAPRRHQRAGRRARAIDSGLRRLLGARARDQRRRRRRRRLVRRRYRHADRHR